MGWHAPQLERGGEQLDGRVERPLGDQPARLGGLLVGEHERLRGRSHAANTQPPAPVSSETYRESVGPWPWARARGVNRIELDDPAYLPGERSEDSFAMGGAQWVFCVFWGVE